MGITQLLSQHGFGSVLLPYQRREPPARDDLAEQVETALEAWAHVPYTTQATMSSDRWSQRTSWTVPDSSSGHPDNIRLTIHPISVTGRSMDLLPAQAALWSDLSATDVTPFHVVTAEAGAVSKSTVIKARLVGGPSNRFELAIAEQLSDPARFERWLRLLLGEDASVPPAPDDSQASRPMDWSGLIHAGLFELLLTSLADRPSRFELADRVIHTMIDSGRPLPPGFLELWQIIVAAAGRRPRSNP